MISLCTMLLLYPPTMKMHGSSCHKVQLAEAPAPLKHAGLVTQKKIQS